MTAHGRRAGGSGSGAIGGSARRAVPAAPPTGPAAGPEPSVRDLRGFPAPRGSRTGPVRLVRELRYPVGDLVVASGLPGSGKSTLMKRTVPERDRRGRAVLRVDSQDTRERFEAWLPVRLPYAVYRPLVRIAHYAGLRRALRSGASLVVHDCGTPRWVRPWLARHARRQGRDLHLVLLDVEPALALAGQAARGRMVSRRAFRRHVRAVRELVTQVESGRPPPGCASVALLDRGAADALGGIGFG
ncbi:AAA family ATPase [Streptomyces palmae]|uniref:AAA family ATPase n=1 Tax=Streptomyces palmae TaxID=1701085 RepID=UPI0035EDA9CA